MTDVLPCVEVSPDAKPAGTVIWLHGLGADGHDFEPLVPILELPRIRFVFPHAPEIPVTIDAGAVMPAWYDIRTLDFGTERENAQQIRASALKIEALIARENDRGIPTANVVLAGFSQGGAMALHVGSRYPVALRGLVILSAYLVMANDFVAEAAAANRQTPALFCHGRNDPLVPMLGGSHAHDAARKLDPSRPIEWHEFPMGHEVCPAEIGVIKRWLHERYQ